MLDITAPIVRHMYMKIANALVPKQFHVFKDKIRLEMSAKGCPFRLVLNVLKHDLKSSVG